MHDDIIILPVETKDLLRIILTTYELEYILKKVGKTRELKEIRKKTKWFNVFVKIKLQNLTEITIHNNQLTLPLIDFNHRSFLLQTYEILPEKH